jgi:hypothetical protein
MDKLSVPDRALLFIGYWSLDQGYQTVTDNVLTEIFPTLSNARIKNILRGLSGRGFLHRKRQKKKERVDESSEESTADVFRLVNRMFFRLRDMKTKEEKEIALARIREVMNALWWKGQLRRKKKKKKRGPRPYVYSITREGIKRCNMLIGMGYRVWADKPMEQWSDKHIQWFFELIPE